ncbi:hypothetical protein [Burkholderia vietnamiensis]|uniref:hypothetical protein n=1 Tax=Burkholderia vietnamiensis TaxID=60552 RepID=UPI001CF1F602|nr:hypothetical protein [Burkholderia vietnamiensis]MCA8287632.1 hypothetical protein [Burkholderia vietnamiensis]
MNVRQPLSNVLPTSITTEQRQMLVKLSTAMHLPLGTVCRVLITGVFAVPLLRARVPEETSRQKGWQFAPATDRCSVHVLVDDRTQGMVTEVMDSTKARRGEVARAALIVAAEDLQRFHDDLRSEAQARAEAKGRGQRELAKRLGRTNHSEVRA